jgi:hypothetical protein
LPANSSIGTGIAAGFPAANPTATAEAAAVLTQGVSNVMLLKSIKYAMVLACGVLALAGATASADDKDKNALAGVWVLKGGELKLTFSDKDVLKISPHGDKDVLLIVCKYTVEKEGLVKVKITELEGKEEAKEKAKEHVPVGLEFSFTWKAKDATAKLSDIKGDKADILKSHLEGEYSQKK